MMEIDDNFQCNQCNSSFNHRSSLNRHLRTMHKSNLETKTTRVCRIKCILCSFDQVMAIFPTYNDYNKHLVDVHQISVYLNRKTFESEKKFNLWYEKGKRNVNYAIQTFVATPSGKTVYYNCNRSDSRGSKSQCTKNMLKTGGSVKMQGTCPSRIIANFIETGHVIVQYFETHVGHEEEVRAQRLTKKEQIYLVDQMKQGVSKERIIANARNFNLPESGLPGRINSINSNDLFNLSRRHNVENIKHINDLVATAMKVEECNSYHGRKVLKAHRAAEELVQYVNMVSAGKYQVGKLSHEYDVHFNCMCNCKQMFCNSCEICVHSFTCTCYEFTIKTSTCKHIHAVAMYEKRGQVSYVLDNIDIPSLANYDALVEPGNTTSEIDEFLMAKRESKETETIDDNRQQEMFRERMGIFANRIYLADNDTYNFFQRGWNLLVLQTMKKLHRTTNKRK